MMYNVLFSIYFCWGIICMFFLIFFFPAFYTNKIILLLKENGFYELAEKFESYVERLGGPLPFRGVDKKLIGEFEGAWRKFLKLKIKNTKNKLYRYQIMYKIIVYSVIFTVVTGSLAFFSFIVFMVAFLITK